jgi:alpha-tubulin suppressor-like RCC1 family protein
LIFDSFSKLRQSLLQDSQNKDTSDNKELTQEEADALAISTGSSISSRRLVLFSSVSCLLLLPLCSFTASRSLYSWGAGYHGQLGINIYRKKCKLEPALLEFKEPVVQVACGGFHTLVLTDTGRVFAWGDGTRGQLGSGEKTNSTHNTMPVPTRIETFVDHNEFIVFVAAGQYHSAAVTRLLLHFFFLVLYM